MESEDIEEIMGDPVWNVEDRDRGIMDLWNNKLHTIHILKINSVKTLLVRLVISFNIYSFIFVRRILINLFILTVFAV